MAKGRNPGILIPAPGEASISVRTAIQQIVSKLGMQASPVFAGLTVPALTLSGFSGILRADNGIVSGNALTYDIDLKAILVNL